MTEVLDGKVVSKAIITQMKQSVKELKKIDCFPTLAVVRIGSDPGSISYENAAIKTMNRVGIEPQSFVFEEGSASNEVLAKIDELNLDPSIHGILVMQPLPRGLSRNELAKRMDPEKDIDGLTPENLGRLVENDLNVLLPSTPKAVMELLRYYEIDLVGKDICVVGSSPVVGKPLSILLLNAKATVSNCHIDTKDIKKYTKQADILISATGVVGLITADHVKKDALVIDVGFGYKDGKPCGDVKYEEVFPVASAITPVPGGVGSITTAVLAEQVVKSAWAHHKRII